MLKEWLQTSEFAAFLLSDASNISKNRHRNSFKYQFKVIHDIKIYCKLYIYSLMGGD